MGSTSPPGEIPTSVPARPTNGIKITEQESRFPRPPAKSPPTGPRLGVNPHRPSPDRKGANYRRDWTSPDNSGGLYRDGGATEMNRRNHPESGPRHAFKHVDTYKPSYPSGRAHACDDSSQSPPLRQGLDKGHLPANRGWDPVRDQTPLERSRSPLQRAREVADRLNNLPKAKEGSNQGQKRSQPLERNQEDSLSQSPLLSRGLLSISQRPSGHHTVQGNSSAIAAPNESIQWTHPINSEPQVISGSPRTSVLGTSVILRGNSIGDSSNAQPSFSNVLCATKPNAPSGTTTTPRLPPKPPVIQPPNLSYEGGLHILSDPLKSQQTTHLQPPVEDAHSVVSDLTVATRKSTSSLSSASVASWEMKPRTCHLCKGYISSEYDLVTGSEITQEGAVTWRCLRCTKMQRASSHFNNTPTKSSSDSPYQGTRQSPTLMSSKTTVVNADGQPPRKRLKTETSEFATAPDTLNPQHPFETMSKEGYAPVSPTGHPPTMSESLRDLRNSNSNAAPTKPRDTGEIYSGVPDAPNLLPIPGGASRFNNLLSPLYQSTLTMDKRLESSLPRLMELGNSNLISSPRRSYDSTGAEMTLSSTEISSHLQYSNSSSKPVPIGVPRVNTHAPTVAPPWRAGTPTDMSSGLGFGIQTLRAGALSPKGSQSGTDQSTSSGITSDIPRDIESANTSIGSPVVPLAGLEAKETVASKADDELSDTSMSIDSVHSPPPDGKERVSTHENNDQSEQSSPPYSPRLDPFMHSDRGLAPATADTTTPQLSLMNGTLGIHTTKASVNIGSTGRIGPSPKRPSSTILQCSKCGKRLLKVSTGGDDVLCGNCTNRETSQSRQSPLGNTPGKGYVSQGSVTHTPQAESQMPPVNPFNTLTSPSLPASGGTLYLPRTNSYISSSTRRRPEPTPAPGLLPAKRRKPATVARKVASVPNHTYQASQGNTPRPNMKKANELRTPEKAKPPNPHAIKKVHIVKPDPPAISSETGLLEEALAVNEELQRNLESQRSALQNYASKTRTLSDDLKDKERRNQELSVDAKKLSDQLALKQKRIEELEKIEDENGNLHLLLENALSEIKQRVSENRVLEEETAQALNDRQQALKEKNEALNEKQQAIENSQLALTEKQQTYIELQEQQRLLRLERERTDIIQKRQESIERKRGDSPPLDPNKPPLPNEVIPTNTAGPMVPFADLEYDTLNPFETFPDLEAITGEIPAKPVAKVNPNSSRRFKKLSTRQRLDFVLMDRRFIHRQRQGHPSGRGSNPSSNGLPRRNWHSEAENNRDPLDSSESDDSDTDIPIGELVGAPAEIMPTIQENGRLCFRDGALGANGKLPRAKIFHKVGKLDTAGQIR
ncbi:MAG: hypothetical protein M1840_006126 [Geoglossum simile]|nr:MAG: hypothetical protein M1840_006126 [Geoglossum simile]